MFDPDDPSQREDVETWECPMCHRDVPVRETVTMGGRRLCFGCASGWYEDEDPNDE
jgi:hypothetical protein